MKLPRRMNYMFLLAGLAFALAIRYPLDLNSQVGIDTFTMTSLSQKIIDQGHVSWIIHPLSYFGVYPMSYPSGALFVASGFSIVSDMPIVLSALVMSFVLGIIGFLGVYLFTHRVIRDDDVTPLLAALAFSIAPKVLQATLWQIPTRALFAVMLPFFFLFLIRNHKKSSMAEFIMLVLILFLIGTSHRLFVFVLLLMAVFIVTYLFIVAGKIFRLKLPRIFLAPAYRRRAGYINTALITGIGLFLLTATDTLESYEVSQLRIGDDVGTQIFNMTWSLSVAVGILFPISVVGLYLFIQRRDKRFRDLFVIAAFLAFLSTLFMRQYNGYYFLIITSLFVGYFMSVLIRKWHRKGVAIVMALFVGGTGFTLLYMDETTTFITGSEQSAGAYIRVWNGTFISNNLVKAARLGSVTNTPYLPVVGPEAIAFGWVEPDELGVRQIPLMEIDMNDDSLFVVTNIYPVQDWANIMVLKVNPGARARYDFDYVLEDMKYPSQYTWFTNRYPSDMLLYTHATAYKVYEDSSERIWMFTLW